MGYANFISWINIGFILGSYLILAGIIFLMSDVVANNASANLCETFQNSIESESYFIDKSK